MAQQNLNVGTALNDGTGDVLRTAFIKIQNNFSDVYTNYVSNTQLIANLALYQTLSGLQANITPMSVNAASYIGILPAANVVSNAQLSSNLANYQTLAGMSSNVVTYTANNTLFVGSVPAANVVSNAQLVANLSNYTTTTLLPNIIVQNTSNNTNYFSGQLPAYYTNATNISTGTLAWARMATGSVNTSASFTFDLPIAFSSNISVQKIATSAGNTGTTGQYLSVAANGAVTWVNPAAFDTTLTYTFSNTITYSSNVNFTGVINAAGANTLNQILTDTATITWNAGLGQIGKVTLAGNRVMASPTNLKIATYILYVYQDATGSRTLTWNSVFKWTAGVAPTLSTTAGALDVFTFVSDGTYLYGSFLPNVR